MFCVRVILFAAFTGHGLVSLHLSNGYNLHYNIFSSVNIFNVDVDQTLRVFGILDIAAALLFLFNFQLKYLSPLAILYLLAVGISGGIFFMHTTGRLFGVAELFRRVPWMFCALFLWVFTMKKQKHHYLLRIGIAFAFIAHGFASLGFFGLSGGHVELASKILSEEAASRFVYYSGISDSILGLLLITGLLSRWASLIGSLWLILIVYLSFETGIPEGIFRLGFLFMCIYVLMDKKCHNWKYEKIITNHTS